MRVEQAVEEAVVEEALRAGELMGEVDEELQQAD